MIIALLTAAILFFIPSDARAWGTGAHLYIARGVVDSMLLNGSGDLPAMLVRNYAAFALGNIMPDVFAVRDWFLKPTAPLVHGWTAAHRLLRASQKEEEAAFSLGYISHLSSDVICHNFFIPGYAFTRERMGGMAHIIAEARVEGYIGHPWGHDEVSRLLGLGGSLNEFFVTNAGLGTKEFKRHSALLENAFRLKVRSRLDDLAFRTDSGISSKADSHIGLSIGLSANAVKRPFDSPALDYCPDGGKRIDLSMMRRRAFIRLKSFKSFRKRIDEGKFDYIHRVPQSLRGLV